MAVAQLSSRAHVARLPRTARSSAPRASRAVRCNAVAGFIGSSENVIMVASVTAFMVAGRFGLAPATNRKSGPVEGKGALTLTDRDAGLVSKDPAGAKETQPSRRANAVNRTRAMELVDADRRWTTMQDSPVQTCWLSERSDTSSEPESSSDFRTSEASTKRRGTCGEESVVARPGNARTQGDCVVRYVRLPVLMGTVLCVVEQSIYSVRLLLVILETPCFQKKVNLPNRSRQSFKAIK